MVERNAVTGIILCGGKGSRLHGQDKPLVSLGDRRVIDRVIERLLPQVNQIIVSCSRNVAIYESLGYPIAIDTATGQGPLAGLTEAFGLVDTEWALSTPGDTPFIPRRLIDRLQGDAERDGVAVPEVDGVCQNLCLLLNRERRQQLANHYATGGLAVKDWLAAEGIKGTECDDLKSEFFNINTPADLTAASAMLAKTD